MKLKSFSIKHFRSIVDSGVCYVSEPVTCLAGLNGSGKSAILEALSLFGYQGGSHESVPDAHPVRGGTDLEVRLDFLLEPTDVSALETAWETTIPKSLRKRWSSEGIAVSNISLGQFNYQLPKELPDVFADERKTALTSLFELFKQIDARYKTAYAAGHDTVLDYNRFWKPINAFKSWAQENGDDEAKALATDAYELYQKVRSLRLGVRAGQYFEKAAPPIIAVNTRRLHGIDPSEKISRTLDHVATIGDTTLANIRAQTIVRRKELLAEVIDTVGAPLRGVLVDDELDFSIEVGRDEQFVGFNRGTSWYSLEQISGGTASLLSTLLQTTAVSAPSILLIDEPDAGLHVDAQIRLRAILEEFGQANTIIYASHSPFMVPVSHPFCIRLVERGRMGTKIHNNPHDTTFAETMTPIYKAIGFAGGAKSALFGKRNVLLEGVVDSAYLNAIAQYVEGTSLEPFSLIPLVGASRAQHLASILEGWRLEYAVLVDSDAEGNRVRSTFDKGGRADRVHRLFSRGRGSIEDIVSKKDFDDLVLAPLTIKRRPGETNMDVIKRCRVTKKLAAQTFASSLQNRRSLSPETLGALDGLATRLSAMFASRSEPVANSDSETSD